MSHKVITPLFPTYAQVAALMKSVTGYSITAIRGMITAIRDQAGTPQNPVDWSEPDKWISERLSGDLETLAYKIWAQDNQILNPRHSYGAYMFVNNFKLMASDDKGLWRPTDKGVGFLNQDPNVLYEIDEKEGLLQLLELLASRDLSKRGDLLPEWQAYLLQYSKFEADSTCKSTLNHRLGNLVSRHLVDRQGNSYKINKRGKQWLDDVFIDKKDDPQKKLLTTIQNYNKEQKKLLAQQLSNLDPYRFEQLIGALLEAMGYEDVLVTKASGDKGVDVVGSIQVGITTIIEVVQVKRIQGSIARPVIDQLRGALPYHKAIRGTLITTGHFSKNCAEAALYPGAAPITLIDGERLLELLIENNVGVRRNHSVELLEVNMTAFDDVALPE